MQKNFNNIGIGIVSLISVLNLMKSISLDKVFLIIPFFTHQKLLNYLANENSNILSIEQLISHKVDCFSNYDKRYEDNIVLTINSIQYLTDMEYIVLKNGELILKKELPFHSKMGKRANKIYKAASNVAKLLEDNSYNLYLSLKVKI